MAIARNCLILAKKLSSKYPPAEPGALLLAPLKAAIGVGGSLAFVTVHPEGQPTALFWLDAGYYGWVGVQGDQQRLSAELEMILSHPHPHVILLDDARGLTGQDGIPSVAEVKSYVESKFSQRQVEVRFDIMRITRRE